jgi:hypothetical protein
MQMHPPWLSIIFHLRGQLAAVIDAPLQIQAGFSAAARTSIPSTPPCGGNQGAPGGHALPMKEFNLLVPLSKSRSFTEF